MFFRKVIKNHGLSLLALTFFVAVAYFNALHGAFLSDDVAMLKDPHWTSFSHIFKNDLYIISGLARYITVRIGGNQPFFYHLTNISFHLLNVWLVYFLILTMTQKESYRKKLAFFTAGFFAVHPLLTETVTWISGMGYALFTIFILSSFITFIKYIQNRSLKYYFVSVVLFIFSILVSDKAFVFSLILVMYYLTYLPKEKNWKLLIPYFISSLLFIFIVIIPQFGARVQSMHQIANLKGSYINFVQPVVTFASYLRLFIYPSKLTLYHTEPIFQSTTIISYAVLIGYIAMLLYFWCKEKKIFFWLIFFVIATSYAISPFLIASFIGERYVYLGSIGIFYFLSCVLIFIDRKLKNSYFSWTVFILLMIILIARTIVRNNDWQTPQTFWAREVLISPYSYQTHNNYGIVLFNQHDYTNAEAEFKKSLILAPNIGETHQDLAYVYHITGSIQDAFNEYEDAIKLDPTLWRSYGNLAVIYFANKDYDDALVYSLAALKGDPTNSDIITNIGLAYLNKGDKTKAREWFEKALRLDPMNSKAADDLKLIH